MQSIYFDQYNDLKLAKQKNVNPKYDNTNLFLETYNYDNYFENGELTGKENSNDKRGSDMPPLEDHEEVKQGKNLEIRTPNKLLTRLPILLAQIKVEEHLHKLKRNQTNIISFVLTQ